MSDCSNLLKPKVLRIFGRRPGELRPAEQWKLDLQIPMALQKQNCLLSAADAARIYLELLQKHLCTFPLTFAASASAESGILCEVRP